ncbi:MAG: metal ABC transporter ATP-binding protein [Mediterranea sp.]|nr:metal ABC transporter ATP-binding protein [Mediterranea sp.]
MSNDCGHIHQNSFSSPSKEEENVVVALKNISVAYDNKTVLHDVDLNIYKNDFLGIIGPNGGGKTTLVRTILGFLQPKAGSIRFFEEGKPVNSLTMGYLPQYSSIDKKFPICVEEVILSGLSSKRSLIGRFTREQKDRAHETIARMGLEGLEKRPIGQLSGGQLQRALLGRAVISDPCLLILDEPSTYIDKHFEARLYGLLTEINKDCAIVLVSHDIGTVLQNVKSIACVNETLDYHPDTGITSEWLEKSFHCPIDLLGHGTMPHRVLGKHGH